MTPAQEAKHLGLDSLKTAMEITGENRDYFAYMHKHKPIIFRAVIRGLVEQRMHEKVAEFQPWRLNPTNGYNNK